MYALILASDFFSIMSTKVQIEYCCLEISTNISIRTKHIAGTQMKTVFEQYTKRIILQP